MPLDISDLAQDLKLIRNAGHRPVGIADYGPDSPYHVFIFDTEEESESAWGDLDTLPKERGLWL